MRVVEYLACLYVFFLVSGLGVAYFLLSTTKKSKLQQLDEKLNKTNEEKYITEISLHKEEHLTKWQQFKANLKMFGIDTSPESMIAIALAGFFVGFIATRMIFRGGTLLMTYIGMICFAAVFVYFNSKIESQKEKLGAEFLEKLRDISTYLSVGKTISNSIDDVLTLTQTSPAMTEELDKVRRELSAGHKESEAFTNMYKRLGLEEIRVFAQSLTVFQESGGDLIAIMKAQDAYFLSKLEAKSTQNIFVSSLRTTQKFVVGLPLILVVGVFLLNPDFFGDFYATLIGQIIAIVCITILLLGIYLSNSLAKKM